jgi:SAM-dependent methyltransferase
MAALDSTPLIARSGPRHWFPRAAVDGRPHSLWYAGWAAYVNRGGYLRALAFGAPTALGLAVAGMTIPWSPLLTAALALTAGGGLVFLISLHGIYRMYGPPAARYVSRLLELGGVGERAVIADLHIGTWRHSHLLAELRPGATVHSVNCWNAAGPPSEANVKQLHELEGPPQHPRFEAISAVDFRVPLADRSCDAVMMGFGIHEIEPGGPRERLFDEARRLLRPGGKLLLFEHLVDLENFIIFGPGIGHWPRRRDWFALLEPRFAEIAHERARQAVDLFVAVRPGESASRADADASRVPPALCHGRDWMASAR